MATTPINVLIDGKSIVKQFDHVSIKFSEGTYCNSIDLSVISKELWDKFDPITFFGKLKLEVPIGSTNYAFLIEERNTTVGIPGISFTVWGRSAQALLDRPYSNTVNDEEEKIHPWQIDDVKVKDIIEYAIDYCCSSDIKDKVSVHWDVEDFTVYKDTFSVSHNSPIEIISTLAGIIGAEFVANADGSLTVQEYSVKEGSSVQEYNDVDHIVSLNDEIVYPIGYNAVTVNGYGSKENQIPAYLSPSLQEDDLKGWEFGKYRIVRVYNYHPKGLAIEASVLKGDIKKSIKGKQTFTEWVILVWGSGNTQYPNLFGETVVKGDEDEPLEFRQVEYECSYQDFLLASELTDDDDPAYGVSSYYFSDLTNTATLSFEYYDTSGEIKDQPVIQLDWEDKEDEDANKPWSLFTYFWRPGLDVDSEYIRRTSTVGTVAPSSSTGTGVRLISKEAAVKPQLKFRVWGPYWDLVEKCFDSVYNTITPNLTRNSTITKLVEEEIGFSDGEGNLSRPYYSSGDVQWYTPGGGNLLFQEGMTLVKISGYKKNQVYAPFAIGKVSYKSNYTLGHTFLPDSYKASEFYVYLKKIALKGTDGVLQDSEYLSISQAVENEDIETPTPVGTATRDITIQVKDFATEVVVVGAAVIIDGRWIGTTDDQGLLNVIGIRVGDHSIRIQASGYLDSDEDELANDTFTVTADDTGTSGQII
jgi:hypothetical protein